MPPEIAICPRCGKFGRFALGGWCILCHHESDAHIGESLIGKPSPIQRSYRYPKQCAIVKKQCGYVERSMKRHGSNK